MPGNLGSLAKCSRVDRRKPILFRRDQSSASTLGVHTSSYPWQALDMESALKTLSRPRINS